MNAARSLSRLLTPFSLLIVALAVLLFALAPSVTAKPPGKVAAATENDEATRAALTVMKQGGNAIDGAITAALVAGVASPTSSGIGGGGFALVWSAAEKKITVLDFRETAPAGLDPTLFENRPLEDAEAGEIVGVPGEVAGLFELHRRFGKKPWNELVDPAARTAERGYVVSRHVGMVVGFLAGALEQNLDLAALFVPGGTAVPPGARVKNPKLGKTLRRIAAEGPKAFYEGAIAADIVEAVRSRGGAMTAADLSSYKPLERAPIHVRWQGQDVYTMPPPSAGGVMLAEVLRLYDRAELQKLGHGTGAYVHWIAEGMRGALADRLQRVGDPAFVSIDIAALISEARMKKRKATFGLDRTHALPRFKLEEHGTHHLVTADGDGNVVSLTTTVNRPFGSQIVARGSGVVLNDELDDFTPNAVVAPFGMTQSPNRARPGARPVSSMTPTIVVRDGAVTLALGGSGGMTIAPNVTEVLLGRLAFGLSLEAAVEAKRFSIPTSGATLEVEPGTPEALVKDLEWRGEIVKTQRFAAYAVQAIAFEDGKVMPVADPRKHGTGAVR